MKGFVPKCLITALVLMIAYSMIVPRVMPKWKTWQSQGQTNVIKAQRYLYDGGKYDAVILGSSLCTRLADDSLPMEVCNLGFGGQGVQDGLKVIARRGYAPKLVAMEINFIFRPENRNFENSVLSPTFYHLREFIPALRDEYQPIGVVKGWASARIEAKRNASPPIPLGHSERDAVFMKMLDVQQKDLAIVPKGEEVDSIMSRLKRMSDELEVQGTRIVLFEMPMDPSLTDLPYPRATREAFARWYPVEKYARIPSPDVSGYGSTDGLHLDAASAADFTVFLRKALRTLE